jgi:eukaryotic-like serine/threonine-protein kinase
MSATARDLPGANLDETVAYEPDHQPGPARPAGSPEMPKPSPQGNYRFAFGSGARPLDGYTIKRAVGRGGFGEVYYATSDSGKEVALKLILHNLDVERRGVVQCMNLKCPNLLTIFDLKTSDAGDTFVVMEYVSGPSLANVLARHPRGLPPAEVRTWLKGLVEGVAYLHDHGIVHRDLKPANLFMEEGIVKIGDYGLAKLIDASRGSDHSESIGTCHYMAPEIASGKYHKPIDVYAIGVILYEMLTGRVPFEGESVGEILMKHLTARPDLSPLPEPYRTIVGRALAKDPAHRPGRVYELLPPEDAPKVPPVRFIGDGKVTPPLPSEPDLVVRDEEEILRIGPEEPVFYIGPETRPPRPSPEPRHRRIWGAARRAPSPAQAPRPVPRPAPAPRPMVRRETPPAPLAPPPLPSGRVRVAELASSMLWAALFVIVLAFAAAAAMGVDVPSEPQRLAYVIGLGLLGTWAALIANKVLEGHSLDSTTRRFLHLALGVLLGGAGLVLGEWTHVRLHGTMPRPGSVLVGGGALGYLAYFGLLFLANDGWTSLTARDRKARFRVWPIATTGLIAVLLYPLWPFAEPYGPATAVLIAVATQLASPWNEAAAAYARANKGRPRAVA